MMKKWGAFAGWNAVSLNRLWRDEDATTSLEYALMLAFVALSAIAGYQALGGTVSGGVDDGGHQLGVVATPDDGGGFMSGEGPGNGNAYGHWNGHPGNGNAYGHGNGHPGQGHGWGAGGLGRGNAGGGRR